MFGKINKKDMMKQFSLLMTWKHTHREHRKMTVVSNS